jgi:transglutaminase-like putative cysteine protease
VTAARYRVEHETSYVHAGGVSTSQHVAYLTPRALPYQAVRSHGLVIEPAAASHVERMDYFGNAVDQFTILTPYKEMRVIGQSEVEVAAVPPPAGETSAPWETVRDALVYRLGAPYVDTVELSYPSPYVSTSAELAAYAGESFTAGRPLIAAAIDLMHRINKDFVFDSGATTIATPVKQVLSSRRGVCQDFAHLQVGCLRSLGLPARYVSGYLVTHPIPGQPRLVGADASHAWLAAWCPRLGWVDLDPTNDVLPSQRHVTLAWGRDYGDVSPLRGILLGGGDHTLKVAVSVTPLVDEEAAAASPKKSG